MIWLRAERTESRHGRYAAWMMQFVARRRLDRQHVGASWLTARAMHELIAVR